MTISARSRPPSTDGRGLDRIVHAFERHPGAGEARHRPAIEAIIDDLLHAGRVQDRDHHIDEVIFGLMRGGRGFGGVVVTHQRQHAAVARGAGEIGVPEHVAGAVDARALAVPEAEHAVEPAFAAHSACCVPQSAVAASSSLMPERNRMSDRERALRPLKLQVEAAQRRAAIAGDVTRGVEAGAAVALLLHQAQSHQRLIAGDKHPGLRQVVLVVEADCVERHGGPMPVSS